MAITKSRTRKDNSSKFVVGNNIFVRLDSASAHRNESEAPSRARQSRGNAVRDEGGRSNPVRLVVVTSRSQKRAEHERQHRWSEN